MSRQQIDELIAKLGKESKPYNWLKEEISKIEELEFMDFDLDMLELLGLGIFLNANNEISLKTRTTKIKEEIFCVVDIETSGSIRSGQIIEIGAVKIQNSKEIARFQSLIKATDIPPNIEELTGINLTMLKNAPSLASVLNEFRIFLKDSIFVAHNVNFDYNFISSSLSACDFGILLNKKLCTIELARRIILSERYGLDSLKEILNINTPHHRALSDALAASEILKYCLSKLPRHIKTTEELIGFSKSATLKSKLAQAQQSKL
ncbi:3'-5' exonuclease [Campylobacter sp. MIT 99-7217]|uniref:3'-5' exonuclease n=1 Tax=Campylobacter sp. MIT 99-7217 TaxID=535091 RepID=UPI00115A52AA|nr:3'-5' exonuclease [Campylobacter sp. MIT 99-7217]TQR29561.1 3'-5' exonuclease [Campylobacter sp. MIT 99-7217]